MIQRSAQHEQSFTWSTGVPAAWEPPTERSEDGKTDETPPLHLFFLPAKQHPSRPLDAGELHTVLRETREDGGEFLWRPQGERDPELFARWYNAITAEAFGYGEEGDLPPAVAESFVQDLTAIRERIRSAEEHFLARLSECLGFGLAAPRWRALHPNAVWHKQFGPGVTAATDGARCVLLAGPYFGRDWMLVHNTNVQGPLRSTYLQSEEWNWHENKPALFGRTGPKKEKPDPVALAQELLQQVLAKLPPQP